MIRSETKDGIQRVEVGGPFPEIVLEYVSIIRSFIEKGIMTTEEIFVLASDAVATARKKPMSKARMREMMESEEGRKAVEMFMRDIAEVVNDVENE